MGIFRKKQEKRNIRTGFLINKGRRIFGRKGPLIRDDLPMDAYSAAIRAFSIEHFGADLPVIQVPAVLQRIYKGIDGMPKFVA